MSTEFYAVEKVEDKLPELLDLKGWLKRWQGNPTKENKEALAASAYRKAEMILKRLNPKLPSIYDIEDIIQNGVISFLRHAANIDPERASSTYLETILKNTIRDAHRRESTEKNDARKTVELSPEQMQELQANALTPHEAAEYEDEECFWRSRIAELPMPHRKILEVKVDRMNYDPTPGNNTNGNSKNNKLDQARAALKESLSRHV